VFLAGDRVLKLKKPVDFGFLDYSTRELRRYFCQEETRLNRRLAPDVYLGVAGVAVAADGCSVFLPETVDLDRSDVEPAVLMRRLPEENTLAAGLREGPVTRIMIERLAKRLAQFHGEARRGPDIENYGRFETVAGNARENFEQTRTHLGLTVPKAVWQQCEDATQEQLVRLRGVIDRRAASRSCETHGDLRLDHVYFHDDHLEVIDCIEFNDRLRFSDAASDIAFLSMELRFAGERGLAQLLERVWIESCDDLEAGNVLPFYIAYRSIVRAKVRGFLARDESAPAAVREDAAQKALAHWLLALRVLQDNDEPSLVLVGGLPGTGKSAVAQALAELRGYRWIRADSVRKELAGISADADGSAAFGEGLYTEEWTERTYTRCEELTREALRKGERVVVDATFRDPARRRGFETVADALRVPFKLLICEAPAEVTRGRIRARSEGPSDAGVDIYDRAAESWERPEAATRVDTSGRIEATRKAALRALRG
jgi:aminoglycoside phosphotransferase family enzyme/predicted kinase